MRATHWSNQCSADKRIQIQGANNSVLIGDGTTIYNLQIIIHGNHNKLIIGKDCIVCGFMEICGDGNEITIGDYSIISENVRITAHGGKYIRIGSSCVIANLSDIRTTDSHSIFDAQGDRINCDKNIEIGDRVWLAREVIVLKGAIISNDSVIGARSIVTKEIPPNSLAAGIPARIVKKDITWSV
jgi:acetyltransferase-like isoleucine patch superfamily enzyme